MDIVSRRFVTNELKALIRLSQGIKKLVRDALERLESDPRAEESLEDVPPDLSSREDLYFPKVKITNGPHDFRILAVGVKQGSGDDYVELLYVFRRKDGYKLDWDWIRQLLPAGPEEVE